MSDAMRNLDWHLLEYFRVVGQHQHVGKAALELGTSQPALSRAIARLENRVGTKLFERVGRSIALSEHGRTLLGVVERAYGEIDEVQATFAGRKEPAAKTVALGFIRTLGIDLVPQAVRDFQSENPHIQFTFFANNAPAIEERLERGELDLIFTALPPNKPDLACKKVMDQELVIIAAHTSRLAKRQRVHLRDLANVPFVTYKRGHMIRNITDWLCNVAGFMPQICLEVDDSGSIPAFVGAGFGVALVPRDSNLPRSVVILPTPQPVMLRPMGLAWIEGRYLHANARAFRTFVLRGDSASPDDFLRGAHGPS
jgi:DNA-binding transcriptional LysR family regulator